MSQQQSVYLISQEGCTREVSQACVSIGRGFSIQYALIVVLLIHDVQSEIHSGADSSASLSQLQCGPVDTCADDVASLH